MPRSSCEGSGWVTHAIWNCSLHVLPSFCHARGRTSGGSLGSYVAAAVDGTKP